MIRPNEYYIHQANEVTSYILQVQYFGGPNSVYHDQVAGLALAITGVALAGAGVVVAALSIAAEVVSGGAATPAVVAIDAELAESAAGFIEMAAAGEAASATYSETAIVGGLSDAVEAANAASGAARFSVTAITLGGGALALFSAGATAAGWVLNHEALNNLVATSISGVRGRDNRVFEIRGQLRCDETTEVAGDTLCVPNPLPGTSPEIKPISRRDFDMQVKRGDISQVDHTNQRLINSALQHLDSNVAQGLGQPVRQGQVYSIQGKIGNRKTIFVAGYDEGDNKVYQEWHQDSVDTGEVDSHVYWQFLWAGSGWLIVDRKFDRFLMCTGKATDDEVEVLQYTSEEAFTVLDVKNPKIVELWHLKHDRMIWTLQPSDNDPDYFYIVQLGSEHCVQGRTDLGSGGRHNSIYGTKVGLADSIQLWTFKEIELPPKQATDLR